MKLKFNLDKDKIDTPILFLIFNRPDLSQKVFNEIRKVKPNKLFVAADGPRDNIHGEAGKCQAARDIIKQVDWQCEVNTLFRKMHLGCKAAVSFAIDWFFNKVEEGIILEDDCVPNPSFFLFCQELLKYFRDDERIMMISGDNYQNGKKRGNGSYYFSKYSHIWGWATWKRAWKYYDMDMRTFPEFDKGNYIANIFDDKKTQKYWLKIFRNVYTNKIDSWGYRWTYAIFCQNGLCILPNINLITNIGFRPDATHTDSIIPFIAKLKQGIIKELIHPYFMLPDKKADEYTSINLFRINNYSKKVIFFKVLKKIKNLISYTKKHLVHFKNNFMI